MSWISLSLIFGIIHAVGAQTLEITSLTACVNDSIALPRNDPSRLVERSWWRARYQDGPWIEIGHCVKTKGCINSTTVLPDGTRAWIGINESLIVQRSSDQRNATAQFQFLVEDNLKRRHIFKVNFKIYCIWTELGGHLNLSQIALGLYTRKHLVELYLFDTNGTQIALIHRDKGAYLQVTNKSHPATSYWNRLRIERGSLIFCEINKAHNGTVIVVHALLNSKQTSTRLGSLSTKTIQIFVFNSTGHHMPSCSTSPQIHSSVSEPTRRPQSSTSLSPTRLGSSSTTGLDGRTTNTSSELAWYKQLWTIIFLPIAATIIIVIIVIFIILLIKKKKESSVSSSAHVA
ncbi:uncharacterized protein LOC114961322 [Acropora millepora]|uniref:uncharacterized protein LOC114961322 n=1 Tax=Acropora millepora TaxID=45264 RepID=UPI001CF0F24C|nr:uncharacterized protein LOC114961322 [Acropora millepora]